MPRGRNKKKKQQQTGKRKKDPHYNGGPQYISNGRNNGPPRSKKDEIYSTINHLSNMTNEQLHQRNYDHQLDDNTHYNNKNYNGKGRKGKKNNNRGNYNNHQNGRHNNNGNAWKKKGGGGRGKSQLNQFFDQLRPLGLGIRNAQSDGNCLFRAISDQISGDENNQASFRKQIVEYMTENSDEFAPFYVGDYTAYLAKMSKNGIWGGNMELTAAAKAFKVDIVIHSLGQPRYEILYQKGTPTRTIHLSYHNERHYASVRRLDDMRSDKPARKINLDKTETEQLQREQQRAEIAWCHNGGNPLDIEKAKDELMDLTPNEQIVVARTGCYDIEQVQAALRNNEGDIEAAVENIIMEMSFMAEEQRKKTVEMLEKQKEDELKEKEEKSGGGDNNKGKKKKKKKDKHKKKNKGKNGKDKDKKDKDKKEKEEKFEEKDDEKKSELVTNDGGDNDEEDVEVPELIMVKDKKTDEIKSANTKDDEELEKRLAEMTKGNETGKKGTKDVVEESGILMEKKMKDPFSVSVKIIPNDDDKKIEVKKTHEVEEKIKETKKEEDGKKKEEEKNKDVKVDLDTKNQQDIDDKPNNKNKNEENEQKKGLETESKELEDKLTAEDIKYIEERDARINAEKKDMAKIKCIKCDFESVLLLKYVEHYKFMHLQGGKHKPKPTGFIECPCGHQNQSDFSFCSECGWDLRFKPDLPQEVKDTLKKETEQKKKQKELIKKKNKSQQIDPELQKKINFMTFGTINNVKASQLLNTGGRDIIIKKQPKQPQKPTQPPSQNKKRNNNNKQKPPRGTKPLTQQYQKYLNKYWKCKICNFRNLNVNKECMVCTMLNPTVNNNKTTIKSKQNEDFPVLPTNKGNNNKNNSKSWANTAKKSQAPTVDKPRPSFGNKQKPKPKQQPQQKKKNQFGWICPACTMENKPTQQKCHMCKSDKPKKTGKKNNKKDNKNNNNKQQNKGGWVCECTLINDVTATRCGACEKLRPGYDDGGDKDVYHADPHYHDDQDLQEELEYIDNNKPWEQYKDKDKPTHNGYNNNNNNGHNQGKRGRNDGDNDNKQEWVGGGGKCPCGSGKKRKKCCKKLAKNMAKGLQHDKSHKNKFKQGNNDNSYNGYDDYNNGRGGYGNGYDNRDAPMTGDHMIDQLNRGISRLEYEIANFKGRNAKQEKIIMQKQLEKLRQQKNALYKKNQRERDQQIKARNRQQRNDVYDEPPRSNNKNKKGGRNNNNNGGNNKQQRREEERAAANAAAASRIIAI